MRNTAVALGSLLGALFLVAALGACRAPEAAVHEVTYYYLPG